jgi:ribulose-5-phosphate 4-epimerase/fuculose-1-phosphate aldolase
MNAVQQVQKALARLAGKGLAVEPPVLFSVRLPGQAAMTVGDGQGEVETVPFDTADTRFEMHASVYRLRGDAGAILTAPQSWASRLASFPEPMPGVFDEQVRQLGQKVEPFSAATLAEGANAFLSGRLVLTIGFTAERAVLNAELLEKCAKAYLLASLTGRPVGLIPWLVRRIARRRLRKDQQRASAAHARGEVPAPFPTY